MGYFSNREAVYAPYDEDYSYPAPEKQLRWRLEDLEDRLHELMHRETGERDEGEYLPDKDLRYVLPEHLCSASNVRRAIDLAISDLRDQYGIFVGDQPVQEAPEQDEITGMQISFLDILALRAA